MNYEIGDFVKLRGVGRGNFNIVSPEYPFDELGKRGIVADGQTLEIIRVEADRVIVRHLTTNLHYRVRSGWFSRHIASKL